MHHRLAATAALLASALAANSHAATLAADYRFDGNLASSVGTAPSLVALTSGTGTGALATETINGAPAGVYQFNGGAGLQALTTGVVAASAYSIVADVRIDTTTSGLATIAKLVDFKNLTSDAGLYTVAGVPNFYSATVPVGAGIAAFVPDVYAQLVLTRDASSLVSVYLNGTLAFSFNDATPIVSDQLAVIANPTTPADPRLTFFADDANSTLITTGLTLEQPTGAVDRIRLFDGALTAAEIPGLVPEPASLAAIALLGSALVRRRR